MGFLARTVAVATVMVGAAFAHEGTPIQLFEIADRDLPDVTDGDLSDWDGIVPNPLTEADFSHDEHEPPGFPGGTGPDPANLAYEISVGWNESTQRIYLSIQRTDDVYVNQYGGYDPGNIWRRDIVEIMVDGDHSGGPYNPSSNNGVSTPNV